MPIRLKRIYDPAAPDDGWRLLTMRRWPRGIRKTAVSEWDKGLAPSIELLSDLRSGDIDWDDYVPRFHAEMAARPDSIESLAALRRRVEAGETVTLMCSCADENHCHRSLLRGLATA